MSTVLIIDDEAPLRETMRMILESAGFEVIEAEDGVAGLAMFRRHNPPLVITDILMPEKDGIETVRDMRRENANVRIIAVSGGGRVKYKNFLQIAREFGANETLEKPFRREELLEAVRRALTPV